MQRILVVHGSARATRRSQFFFENVDRRKTSRWWRRQQDWSNPGGSHEAHGKFGRDFDRRMDGQIRIYLMALFRGIEKLHDDGSYVLIEGQRRQIR